MARDRARTLVDGRRLEEPAIYCDGCGAELPADGRGWYTRHSWSDTGARAYCRYCVGSR